MTLTFKTLPLSTNHLYRNVPGPGRVLTSEGRANKEAMAWEARAQWRRKPLAGPVAAGLTLFYPNRRRRDLDNALKTTLDSRTDIA